MQEIVNAICPSVVCVHTHWIIAKKIKTTATLVPLKPTHTNHQRGHCAYNHWCFEAGCMHSTYQHHTHGFLKPALIIKEI